MGKINLKNTASAMVERTELVRCYLNDINKFDVLSAKEERELFRKIKSGDENAKKKLIEAEQKYVFATAKRFNGRDKLMDLVQEANAGLIEAIDYFDPDKGVRFLSFASWYIERNIKKYLTNDDLLVRKSNNLKTTYKISKAKNTFFSENGRYPTTDELVDFFKERYGIVIKDESDVYDLKLKSINRNFDGEDSSEFENSSLFTSKTASFNGCLKNEDNDYRELLIKKMLGGLNERDRTIIMMAFGIGYEKEYTHQEIAEELGLTSERVRQICKSSIKKLKPILMQTVKGNL